ncbi:MAG: argininosuccinate lyase [Clostridiales bacterium]|jgi:argininosuccinate lyase|nr:argininosuccinate lyase [Clostridiales bacterium]
MDNHQAHSKPWGGRFTKPPSSQTDSFHSSISFDCRLFEQDIAGSIAHAQMLGQADIIPEFEAKSIIDGLKDIRQDVRNGEVTFDIAAEDIHMNIEKLLIERIGEAGKKLHTGRSRNDQVALDMRMYVRVEIDNVNSLITDLLTLLNTTAKRHTETVLPGYTHLQRAQPITFAFHLLAYYEMFKRDLERLTDCCARADFMPLGSGALAGTTYPLDRAAVASLLEFDSITTNALDAVSDRDFVIEFLSALAIIMMHLSRFCEEIILWSSHEFKFVELDDAYATGSSIMPQKKNPDMAELIRGKCGRVYGDLFTILTVMKGLPLAYNKDMQEDKEACFDAVDAVKSCLSVFCGMLSTIKINKASMRKACDMGFVTATDAADYLAKKGVPFREAHEIIGKLVLHCISHDKSLDELSLQEWREFSPVFEADIFDAIDLQTCVSARKLTGGPARTTVEQAIAANEKSLTHIKKRSHARAAGCID